MDITTASIDEIIRALPSNARDKATGEARRLLNQLKKLEERRHEQLDKIHSLIKRLDKYASAATNSYSSKLRTFLVNYRKDIARMQEQLRDRFGPELERELAKLDLKLDGQYPVLKAGLFTFKMIADRSTVEIWYGPEQELLSDSPAPMLAEKVRQAIEQIQRDLGSRLEPRQFLEKLQQAYDRCPAPAESSGKPIIALLPEVAYLIQSAKFFAEPVRTNYQSYTRADFSYDLYRCENDPQTTGIIRLTQATRMYTATRQTFLWIPEKASGSGFPYSHLTIKEVIS